MHSISQVLRKHILKKRVIACVAVTVIHVTCVAVAVMLFQVDEALRTEGPTSPSVTGRFRTAAVAADIGLCSEIGRDILQQGGIAVDAAISSLLCVGVVNAHTSGLGGGLIMLIYHNSTGKAEALIARERAPAAATENLPLDKFGVKSIAVPGELSGMWEAHQRYGHLPWRALFQPVIRLAENGFPVTAHLAKALQLLRDIRMPRHTGFVAKYANTDGSWKKKGDIVYAPKVARTLRAIAENGVSELLNGTTAQQVIQDIQENGGILTAADLAGYTARWMEAQVLPIGCGLKVVTAPSPSGGPLMKFILNVLKNYNVSSADFDTTGGKIKVHHRFVEASKFAYALGSYLGDVDTPKVREVLNKLQSDDFAREVFSNIRDDRVTFTDASGYDALINTASRDGGTSHLNVVDQYGNAVSVTSSVNNYFGCRLMSNRTGLILNNQMLDFDNSTSQPASSANYIVPGKMPQSAASPVIVLNGNSGAKLVVGSAGSRAIITTNAWVVLRLLYTNATLQESIDEKRIYNQLQPANVDVYEEGFPQDVIDGLVDMGHKVKRRKRLLSVLQAIKRQDDAWIAYSDPRKQGHPAGY